MNEQMNPPALPPPSGLSGWISVWRDAVTKPNEQTYARIASAPDAKLSTALLWVFLGSLLSTFAASLVQGAMMRQMFQNTDFGGQGFPAGTGGGLVAAICGAPIFALISVVAFLIVTGVIQLIARMFGGRGTFEQVAYALAAIATPFSLVSTVLTLLGAIPFVGACFGLVGLVAGLYALVLQIMAVKAVNQFGWGQAIASFLLPVIAIACCIGVAVVAIFQAVGPEVWEGLGPLLTPSP